MSKQGSANTVGCVVRTHGMTKTTEWFIWGSMKQRCLNPKNISYKYYGARGIGICERWMHFGNFYADMGPRPSLNHSLDRIDGSKDYAADNCRWATAKEQNRNLRSCVVMELNGRKATAIEWSEITGLPAWTIYKRLEAGWSVEKTLTQPRRKLPLHYGGKNQRLEVS